MRKRLHKTIIYILIFVLFNNCLFFTESNEIEQSTLNDDDIDQEQTNFDSVELIYNGKYIAQSFTPTLPEITRIKLYLSKKGDITSDILLLIKEELIGPVIRSVSVESKIIPKNQPEWIEFDIPNIDTEKERYFIIFKTDSGDENNYYEIYSHTQDLYKNGIGYTSDDGGDTWEQKINLDYTFITYGAGPVLNIEFMRGLPGGRINIGIENIGTSDANNVEINAELNGGLILKRSFTEKINGSLESSHKVHVEIYPIIGFGMSDLTIFISADDSESINIENEVFVFFIYIYLKPSNK